MIFLVNIPIHRIASALLTMLVVVSIVIILIKSAENHFYYGIPIAGLLSFIAIISSLKTCADWMLTIAAAYLILIVFSASLYFSTIYGWPFGSFQFSDMLGFEIVDNVPWTYPVIWMLFLVTTASLTQKDQKKNKKYYSGLFAHVFDSAFVTTLILISSLPVMAVNGLIFFQYDTGFTMAGLQFYIASFMISMIGCVFLLMLINGKRMNASVTRSLVIASTSIMLFLVVSSFMNALYVSACIGIGIITWVNWKQLYGDSN
jgi:uncharacterized membrane protein